MAVRRGTERVLAKLHAALDNGEFYEAHQMYRTLYFRYSAAGRWRELAALMLDGARALLAHHQHESGADLATLYVATLRRAGVHCQRDTAVNVAELYSYLKVDSPERSSLLTVAVEWSATYSGDSSAGRIEGGGNGRGHPLLHELIAEVLWKEGAIFAARSHFVLSTAGERCAQLLVQIHRQSAYDNELDLIVTHAVLQYLVQRRCEVAVQCFSAFVSHHPRVHVKTPPFALPLLNFLRLLFECVDSENAVHFQALRKLYAPCLSRDEECFAPLLDKVGGDYFNLAPPTRRRGRGLLDGLLQSLFSLDDPVAMETSPPTASHSPVPKIAKMETPGDLD